ncbi:MAG TPA: family 43 glycosylhydrolase, partial [Polyangiaceae bacterium]
MKARAIRRGSSQGRSFENPVIPGFHPDPSVCRVGDDFYLVTSSFEYFPGVPIFHSRDLVHFRQLGHVLTRRSQLDLTGIRSSGGIYAPTLRHHGGRFYMITTNVDGGGNFYVTAHRPEGPWSNAVWLDEDGIDPSLLFDGGDAYYTRTGPGRDFEHPRIHQAKIDVAGGRLLGKAKPVWPGAGGTWPEAPHLYRRGEYYYLIHAEGGTGYGHSEMVVRSRAPFGPFEACPHNPIVTHRDRPRHPIQALGHADLVDLPDGTTWAVLLGIRPKRGRHHHLGRETFLAPVTWTKHGWPVIGEARSRSGGALGPGRVELSMPAPRLRPVRFAPPPARDDFGSTELEPSWNFLRNPDARSWSLKERRGWLRLVGRAVSLDD